MIYLAVVLISIVLCIVGVYLWITGYIHGRRDQIRISKELQRWWSKQQEKRK